MKQDAIENIRFKLLAPYVGSLLIILVAGLWSLNFYQQAEQDAFAAEINEEIKTTFNENIQDDIELFKGVSFFIGRNEKLQQAWAKQDRDDLLANSMLIFKEIKKNYRISHFYFHQLDGTNFLRVHAPQRHGDMIKRETLQQAMESKTISTGIEFGTFGQFVLRVVIPWVVDGQVVGYFELGEEIDHILAYLAKSHVQDLVLTINKQFMLDNHLNETLVFKRLSNSNEQGDSRFIINQTLDKIPEAFHSIINASEQSKVSFYREGRSDYLVSNIDIHDLNNAAIASLFFLTDISERTLRAEGLYQKIAFSTFLSSLILILFYVSYSRTLKTLVHSNLDRLKQEIKGREDIQLKLIETNLKLEKLVEERNYSLGESKKRYRTLFEQTADALLIIEGNAFVDCNQATLDMLRMESKEELYNTHPSRLSPEFQPDGQRSDVKADLMISIAFEKGSHRFEWEHLRKSHEVFPVEVLLTSIPFEGSQLLHVVWRDISERKKAAAEIEHQAYYDQLTGLSNRRLFLDRMTQVLITSRRHHYFGAVLFIDLDRFKSINDSLGHSVGDSLLVEAGARIKGCLTNEDTAAHFSGDEYVVLLRHLGRENKEAASLNAERAASTILAAFKQPFLIQGESLHVTASIGVAMFPFYDESVEDVIKHAETALYSAKENGRNQVSFYLSHMHEKVIKRLELEKDLRNAVKDDALEIYYQPQFDVHGDIVAVEALLRWEHPEHGFVNPEEFVSIAEDTGLIYEMGEFVLNNAISAILSLNHSYKTSINLAVNISPHQFRKRDFVEIIKSVLGKYQLEKGFLTLELTERIAIENLNDAIEKIDELRHNGARLSLDDFGTGYSSLSHLKKLPIDELKIDKSFVFDIEKDPQDALLVQTIIKIAHQFKLDVVAEGVETQEQLEFLKYEGCDIYQGYFYSKPLPFNQLKVLIKDIQGEL